MGCPIIIREVAHLADQFGFTLFESRSLPRPAVSIRERCVPEEEKIVASYNTSNAAMEFELRCEMRDPQQGPVIRIAAVLLRDGGSPAIP